MDATAGPAYTEGQAMTPDREGFVNEFCDETQLALRPQLKQEMLAKLDALLERERERCAKVAESDSSIAPQVSLSYDNIGKMWAIRKELAQAIRAGGKE